MLLFLCYLLQSLFPARISVEVFGTVSLIGLYHSEFLQCRESLVVVLVDAAAHTGALGGTHTTVGVVEFDGCA